MINLPKIYDPKIYEKDCYQDWLEKGYFKPAVSKKETYTIVIPPPNVTDVLHLGHALNNTMQDVLIRWRRMQGFVTLWLPGTDHAGIATQNMVCKELAKEGKAKEDIGRDKFVECLWDWQKQKGGKIIEQLKEIGCSADWDRLRFTLDERLSRAVREVFVRLYEEGLIYKSEYIINWCPSCRTALSDEEAEHKPMKGHLWYIEYPFEKGEGGITVATTRPETMLGDTAIAVNPDDKRYRKLVGKHVILPIMERRIPIIADEAVDMEFGTGMVKVTPAHDPNDFIIGRKHNLPEINVLREDGTMNDNAGKYAGMDRFDCREAIIQELREQGLLKKIEDHDYSAGHCYRCGTLIEPYLSKQWFVNMKPLAEPAKAAVKRGMVKFYPKRWEGVYLDWLENIHDWCISRQIWWGHQLPVWWCESCQEYVVSREDVEKCPKCGEPLVREKDVLDTWFSSWLWPFSTLGWPENTSDLECFYPTDTLVTAAEIIFFWVARMIMAGIHFMGEIPFKSVLIHGTVRDETGRKMSKSLGNGIDPLDIIDQFGRDALRFTLIMQASQGQDLFLSSKSFEQGRNFTNKLWNASRLLFSNLSKKYDYKEIKGVKPKTLLDRWLLSRLNQVTKAVTRSLDEFRLNDATFNLYHFFWHDFCDWALECYKLRWNQGDQEAEKICLYVYEKILRLFHPIIPFVTEALWGFLREHFIDDLPSASIINAPWPKIPAKFRDEIAKEDFEFIQDLITAVRKERNEWNIAPDKKSELKVVVYQKGIRETILDNEDVIKFLSNASSVGFTAKRPRGGLTCYISPRAEVFLILKGLIDIGKESARLEKEIEQVSSFLKGVRGKLLNRDFREKAPREIIEKELEKEKYLSDKLGKLGENYRLLKQMKE